MFQRNINGVTYNCLRTGKDQYHLFDAKPSESNVLPLKYIHEDWKDIDSQQYTLIEVNNLVIKMQPLDMEAFKNELYLQRKFSLNPASVLAAYDAENSYIVSEYFGSDLRDFLANNENLPLVDRIQIILGLLNEVLLLEQQGTMHHDLKPGNICVEYNEVTKAWQVRIIDFGFATPATVTNITGGTIIYMSPDKVIGHASDRFSLGPVIAEILGCNPHVLSLERIKAHADYRGLSSSIARALYDFGKLPGYNFNTLPGHFFSANSTLREQHLNLLQNLVSKEPSERYSIEYLLHFFLQVHAAIQESSGKNNMMEPVIEGFRIFTKAASSVINSVKDSFFGDKKKSKSKKNISTASTTLMISAALDDPMKRDFHAIANVNIQRSSVPMTKSSEYMLLQSFLSYKHKFAGSRSTGIKEIFNKIEQASTVKATLEVLESVGEKKTAAPSYFAGCFACFFTPRNQNIDALYHDFARLNKPGEYNPDVLEDIQYKMANLSFV